MFVTVLDVIAKWRAIRDNYVRSLMKLEQNSKSGSAAKRVKLYVYFDQLAFLNKGRQLRPTESSFVGEETEDSAEITENEIDREAEEVAEHQELSPNTTPTSGRRRKMNKPDVERALVDFMEAHSSKKNLLDDEDLAFFYSLLPTLRTLTLQQKFSFRFQTMQLLQNIVTSPTHVHTFQS